MIYNIAVSACKGYVEAEEQPVDTLEKFILSVD
jgi:hypothetical protein